MVLLLAFVLSAAWGAPVPAPTENAPAPTENAPLAPPAMRVQGAARQGGVLFVTVSNAPAEASLRWLNQSYPLAPENGSLRAVLPVPIDTRPGAHPLQVRVGDEVFISRSVTVARVNFPHQSITLPADMLATYDSPRNKADDALLLAAARKFTPQRHWRGSFSLPAQGPLSTGYGLKRTYNGWRKGWHKALDIAAYNGTPIVAPNGAVVAVVAPGQITNGNTTLLDHGLGVYSLYMHQSKIRVTERQSLRKGQRIGDVGATGAGTGPHLHWGCLVHGVFIDPKVLLRVPAGW